MLTALCTHQYAPGHVYCFGLLLLRCPWIYWRFLVWLSRSDNAKLHQNSVKVVLLMSVYCILMLTALRFCALHKMAKDTNKKHKRYAGDFAAFTRILRLERLSKVLGVVGSSSTHAFVRPSFVACVLCWSQKLGGKASHRLRRISTWNFSPGLFTADLPKIIHLAVAVHVPVPGQQSVVFNFPIVA